MRKSGFSEEMYSVLSAVVSLVALGDGFDVDGGAEPSHRGGEHANVCRSRGVLASVAICAIDDGGRVVWEGKTPSEPKVVNAALAPWSGERLSGWASRRADLRMGRRMPRCDGSSGRVPGDPACEGGALGDGGEDRSQRCPWPCADGSRGMVQRGTFEVAGKPAASHAHRRTQVSGPVELRRRNRRSAGSCARSG
jgi:hypothetical protein